MTLVTIALARRHAVDSRRAVDGRWYAVDRWGDRAPRAHTGPHAAMQAGRHTVRRTLAGKPLLSILLHAKTERAIAIAAIVVAIAAIVAIVAIVAIATGLPYARTISWSRFSLLGVLASAQKPRSVSTSWMDNIMCCIHAMSTQHQHYVWRRRMPCGNLL